MYLYVVTYGGGPKGFDSDRILVGIPVTFSHLHSVAFPQPPSIHHVHADVRSILNRDFNSIEFSMKYTKLIMLTVCYSLIT